MRLFNSAAFNGSVFNVGTLPPPPPVVPGGGQIIFKKKHRFPPHTPPVEIVYERESDEAFLLMVLQ